MKKHTLFQLPPTYEACKKQFFIQMIFCCALLIIFVIVSWMLGHFLTFSILGIIMIIIFIIMIPIELRIYKKKYDSGKIK